jgi:enoyl-CoA hydratase
VRADRRSALGQHGLPLRTALHREWRDGKEALASDGIAGARRFRDGLGRHGDFDSIR